MVTGVCSLYLIVVIMSFSDINMSRFPAVTHSDETPEVMVIRASWPGTGVRGMQGEGCGFETCRHPIFFFFIKPHKKTQASLFFFIYIKLH